MRKNNGIYDTQTKLVRSQTEKKMYFKEHSINKILGFDLHHIVSLSFSNNQNDFLLFDKWENMIYINGTSHKIIHQKNSIHTIVDFDKKTLILKSYANDFLRLENFKDVVFSEDNIRTMIDYNTKLMKNE